MDDKRKLTVIVSLWCLIAPLIIIPTIFPTSYHRDVWFYSQYYAIHQILSTGHMYQTIPDVIYGVDFVTRYWGKVSTEINTPMNPIYGAIFSSITGLNPKYLNISFPAYLLVFLSYSALLAHTKVSSETKNIVAALGAITASTPVINLLMMKPLSLSIALIGLLPLIYSSLSRDSISLEAGIAIVSVTATYLFFQNPVLWTIELGVYLLSIPVFWYIPQLRPKYYAPLVGLCTGIPVFLSSSSYGYHAITAINRLIKLEFSTTGSSNSTASSTVLQPESYGLLTAIPLAILGFIGGCYCIYALIQWFRVDEPNVDFPFIGILIWGTVLFAVALAHLASGKFYLVIRAYKVAIPLLIIASAIGISVLGNYRGYLRPLILSVLVVIFLSTFILQATVPHAKINTYSGGAEQYGDFAASYSSGRILGDTKIGATTAVIGEFNSLYPSSNEGLQEMYYENSIRSACESISQHNADYLGIYRDTYTTGVYNGDYSHKPISRDAYNLRVQRLHHLYSNGEYSLLSPNTICQTN